jgi:hypothetical protein
MIGAFYLQIRARNRRTVEANSYTYIDMYILPKDNISLVAAGGNLMALQFTITTVRKHSLDAPFLPGRFWRKELWTCSGKSTMISTSLRLIMTPNPESSTAKSARRMHRISKLSPWHALSRPKCWMKRGVLR